MSYLLNEIDEYIKSLNLKKRVFDKNLFGKINNFLVNIDEEFIIMNKIKIAELFCLNINKLNYIKDIEEELSIQIIRVFQNIGKMEDDLNNNGDVRTIVFLNKLHSMDSGVNNVRVLNNIELEDEFKLLLEHLEQIKAIFAIKINNKAQFPINNLLSTIIKGENFIGDAISVTSFRTLILALEVFKYDGYTEEKKSVANLVSEHKLKAIEYIMNDSALKIGGDEGWNINFDKNGVLILYNTKKKKVLIRSSEEEYFRDPVWCLSEKFDISFEKNKDGKQIAWFCEYDYDETFEVKSLEEFFQNNIDFTHVKNILELVLEKKCYNVFHEQALIIKNNEVFPINPFTKNDKFLCNEISYTRNELGFAIDILKKYSLQVLIGKGIDCATVGLVLELYSLNPVSIEDMLYDIKKTSKNFQNSIILNWLNKCDDIYAYFNKFYSKYEGELEYVKKRNTFEEKEWRQANFYPIAVPDNIINMVSLSNEYDGYKYELFKIEEDYNSDLTYTLNDGMCLNDPKIEYYNDEETEYLHYKKEFIALYSKTENKLIVGTKIENNNKLIEKIKMNNKYFIQDKHLEVVFDIHIKIFLDTMSYHKKSLMEAFSNGTQGNISFDSLVRYKLANNLLCYKIIPDKFDKYLFLLKQHEIINYSVVRNHKIVKEIPIGTLAVPKDRSKAQSVLKDIYNEYIKDTNKRSAVDLYDAKITKGDDNHYYINKNKIDRILFVFDITQGATATLGTLKEYMGYVSEFGGKRQRFYSETERKEVSLKNIIERNDPQIVIDIFYITEKGIKKIEDFCYEKGLNAEIKYCKIIDNNCIVDKKIMDVTTELFGKFDDCVKENDYIVIREFNQPKKNVFPPNMLDPDNIVSLFAKKDELRN